MNSIEEGEDGVVAVIEDSEPSIIHGRIADMPLLMSLFVRNLSNMIYAESRGRTLSRSTVGISTRSIFLWMASSTADTSAQAISSMLIPVAWQMLPAVLSFSLNPFMPQK